MALKFQNDGYGFTDFEYMKEIPTNCRQVLGLYGTEWECPWCGETEGIKCGMNLCPWCGQRFSWITIVKE